MARVLAVRTLLWKELRQMRRSRRAIFSTVILPFMLLVVVPLGQAAAFRSAPPQAMAGLPDVLVERFGRPLELFTGLLLPLFVTMAGVLVPTVAASYTIIAEREQRSLDLLMALPVAVADVLVAKVAAVLLLSAGVVLPLFAVQSAALLARGVVAPGYAAVLLVVLLAALICSSGITFIVTLVARDFRTANNISGLQFAPVLGMTVAVLVVAPDPVRFPLLAALLAAAGLVALAAARRWLTFERYLA